MIYIVAKNQLHCGRISMMEQDIGAFLKYLAGEKGYSPNTLAAYRSDLTQMAAFVASEETKGITKSYDELLMSYLLDLREKRYAAATAARKIASVKSFFKFMLNSGRLKENPTRNLVSPQVNRHSPQFLSPSEYQALLAEPAKLTTPEARRDVMMLELLYAVGLRISELVALNIGDVDLGKSHISCVHGNSVRQVPFDHRIGQLLKKFLRSDRLDLLYDEREKALFLNRRGARLTRQGIWQIIKGYASKAGLGSKVTPYILRHSFAKQKLQTGIDLRDLQQLLGHTYISSTKVYRQSTLR